MNQKYTLTTMGDGKLMLTNDMGEQYLLDSDVVETIALYYDGQQIRKKLLEDPIVSEDQDNIDCIDNLVDYYIAKRNEVIEILHRPVFLTYALAEADADDWDAVRDAYSRLLDPSDQ